ncbi:hypothetical protein Drose_12700 [Dactylosporangium roseum]|uniref:Uncharacterized protein n=1 Tax=Dactylosporangium roseum TaxID=47989 RepID=A0ABY5ZDX1_9ACTN|nr:hypothetical protein [Dactylosporangium roseum]UWZ40356.1 hypothetical protein Drose_12700 [Dactylosporangium roseum]
MTATLVVTTGVAVPVPAHAAGSAGYCPDSTGVTVVVDYNDLGGGIVVRCAPGAQDTGLAALKNAGFTVAGTNRWGEAFICRINGKPAAATEPCVDTPPASAYWSYWHAPDGGSWTYSDKGVKNRTPPQGTFEGWSFSKNHTGGTAPRPGVAPARPAPPPSAPPAGGGQPNQPGPAVPGTTTGPAAGAPAPAATTAAPVASGTAVPSTAAPSATVPGSSGPPTTAQAHGSTPAVDAAEQTDAGVPAGTLAGAGLLVLLVAAGGITARRRRRPPAGDA